jgi:hypothetical protein
MQLIEQWSLWCKDIYFHHGKVAYDNKDDIILADDHRETIDKIHENGFPWPSRNEKRLWDTKLTIGRTKIRIKSVLLFPLFIKREPWCLGWWVHKEEDNWAYLQFYWCCPYCT